MIKFEMSGKRKIVAFEPGQIILKEGKLARGMYVLLAGVLEVSFRGTTLTRITERGEYVGEIEALLGGRRQATVVAATYAELMYIEDVTRLFENSPSSAYMIAKALASRVVEMNKKTVDLLSRRPRLYKNPHSNG